MNNYYYYVIIGLLLLLFANESFGFGFGFGFGWGNKDKYEKVLLKEVKVLTLYDSQMTTGRRSNPVPQLKCTGGSANCVFKPKVVQCKNIGRGWSEIDIHWECKADMDYKYRFGNIKISCEGYAYPKDPYILKGSCGLEYNIDLTEKGHQKENNYHFQRTPSTGYTYGLWIVLFIVLFLILIYCIYKICFESAATVESENPPPPPYPPRQASSSSRRDNQSNSHGAENFQTGLILGNMIGNSGPRNTTNNYYERDRFDPDSGTRHRTTAGDSGSGSSSPGGPNNTSGESRTASGFGNTERR